MLKAKLLAGGGAETIYVDDVFSAYTRTGTGASQVTTTNIDMTQGYMLWSKGRSGATDHAIYDSARGVTKDLVSNTTAAETTQSQGLTAVSATGHTFGTLAKVNTNAATYVDWVFRKAPKFFDVVTYTGNGTAGRTIAHSLGVAPGMMIVKRTDSATDWIVWHRSISSVNNVFFLNHTFAEFGPYSCWNGTAPDASNITLGTRADVNASGGTYVAYLFAHDTATDGLIQCGSFTTDGSGNATVNHGWSAGVQFAAIKASSTTGDWEMYDTARTAAWSGSDARLRANLSNAEDSVSRLSASGTSVSFAGLSASATYVYLFIVTPT